jgi:hypothetical protein
MHTINSFIQAPLTGYSSDKFEDGSPFYTKSIGLYSESQMARYNFYDGKLTLQEIYGKTTCKSKIGRLNVGSAYLIPFQVTNVNIENDYLRY